MGWIASDLYQEHNNPLIKVIHAAKGCNASMDFIADSISTNIEAFKRISTQMETEYKVARNRTYHQSAKTIHDVTTVLDTLEDIELFSKESVPAVEAKTKCCIDLLNDGVATLREGSRLRAIKLKNMNLDDSADIYNSLDPFSL
ncbi:hypothetical protein BGX20_009917 [Mortierella sp. AD010]|nr:hypothetical protein BGX20_009917 [Mortierella sp. AD010]